MGYLTKNEKKPMLHLPELWMNIINNAEEKRSIKKTCRKGNALTWKHQKV